MGAQGHVGAIALIGLDARYVRVEAATAGGLPATRIVGLPDSAVREAADRLHAAFGRGGFSMPQTKRVVNLAPASLRKSGSGFDLPVALAMMVLGEHLAPAAVDGVVAVGEVGLDGSIRPTAGTLPIVAAARDHGATRVVVADAVAPEASLVDGVTVIGVATLREAVEVLAGRQAARDVGAPPPASSADVPDLAEVRGQPLARRALEVAAAGGHHLLLMGPPGCGKSMLARRLPGLLPPLTTDQALEVAAVRSVAGLRGGDEPLDLTPPFRDPHHTTSVAGLIGGGSGLARPGELSLAHRGCLFLDELLETPRWILDALREPIESGRVVLVRAQGTVAYPAAVQLVAAANPCPCAESTRCRCRPDQVERYRGAAVGPAARPHRRPGRARARGPRRHGRHARRRADGRGGRPRRRGPRRWPSDGRVPCRTGTPRWRGSAPPPRLRPCGAWPGRWPASVCRPAPSTAACAWPAPSRTWPGPRSSTTTPSTRPWPTACRRGPT